MKQASIITYTLGYIASVVLTLLAFGLVALHEMSFHRLFSHPLLAALVVLLAIVQMLIQLMLFLHLSKEQKPRWNLSVFVFAVLIVFILVGGTLWIMQNLGAGMDRVLYTGTDAAPQNEKY